jgi:hypothetical protein
MTSDEYLLAILAREAVDRGGFSPVWGIQSALTPTLTKWANGRLLAVQPSGSFMKGTSNKSGTDIDLFISLSEETIETLGEVYEKLFRWLTGEGFSPKRQNVSLNIRVNSHSVDLVPVKRQGGLSTDHSLYRRKGDTWTKTNVSTHIGHVGLSGCLSEIRLVKLWRDKQKLDFPSFYLELTVMAALKLNKTSSLESNFFTVMRYLKDDFRDARVVDPANTNNCISDDLGSAEKTRIRFASIVALGADKWSAIVE